MKWMVLLALALMVIAGVQVLLENYEQALVWAITAVAAAVLSLHEK